MNRWSGIVLAVVLLGACDLRKRPIATPSEPPPPPELLDLPVEGFRPAIVSVPRDLSASRPVMVAAHGAGSRAEWQCEYWRELIGNRGFVLCPRGTAMRLTSQEADDGYFYRTHYALEKEVMAALDALWKAYPKADPGPVVYTGFSQGGIMGALMVQMHPDVFQRLILVEGGYKQWNIPGSQKFKKAGGARVLFACGIAHCYAKAKKSVSYLKRGGVEARAVHGEGAGHTNTGEVERLIRESLEWVLEGDSRWAVK